MNGDSTAARELDALLRDPVLAGRWQDGFTSDDVIEELMLLGHVSIDVRDEVVYAGDDLPPRFGCRLELRDEPAGSTLGEGHSLTAAALRCLIGAEAELSAEVERGLGAFRDLLGER